MDKNHPLFKKVETKLTQAFSEIWINRPPIKAILDENTEFNVGEGGLKGGVTYSAYSKRKNIWEDIHYEPMGLLKDEQAVDDWLAKGLSTLLMLHTRWPK